MRLRRLKTLTQNLSSSNKSHNGSEVHVSHFVLVLVQTVTVHISYVGGVGEAQEVEGVDS